MKAPEQEEKSDKHLRSAAPPGLRLNESPYGKVGKYTSIRPKQSVRARPQ